LTIDRITDRETFTTLREEWDELLASSKADCVFLTWEWLHTWWNHLGAGRQLRLITVRDEGRLVGLLPLSVSPPHWRRLIPFRRREFLGSGSVGSDYLDAIVRSGWERDVVRALCADLAKSSSMLELAQVDRESSVASMLAAELVAWGWRAASRTGDVCPYIDLDGLSWDSYLASVSGQQRYRFRRQLARLEKDFELRVELARTEEDRREALDTVIRLHRERWRRRGGSNALHTQALVAFHDAFTRLALARGWLRLFTLYLDGRPAVSLYALRYGDTFSFYQTGLDPEFARYGAGVVLLGLTVKHAIEEGAREYDLLHGAERYKFHWARQARQLERFDLYPPNFRGTAYRTVMGAGGAVRRVARRLLPATVADRMAGTGSKGSRAPKDDDTSGMEVTSDVRHRGHR
jgi:CelD/BcsL family acetyltransferase involved in cellulose biosynthesis